MLTQWKDDLLRVFMIYAMCSFVKSLNVTFIRVVVAEVLATKLKFVLEKIILQSSKAFNGCKGNRTWFFLPTNAWTLE